MPFSHLSPWVAGLAMLNCLSPERSPSLTNTRRSSAYCLTALALTQSIRWGSSYRSKANNYHSLYNGLKFSWSKGESVPKLFLVGCSGCLGLPARALRSLSLKTQRLSSANCRILKLIPEGQLGWTWGPVHLFFCHKIYFASTYVMFLIWHSASKVNPRLWQFPYLNFEITILPIANKILIST